MAELIVIFVLIVSIAGMVVIVWRKIPILIALPESLLEKGEPFSFKLKKKIKEFNPFKNFSYELFLQKLISKIRILILKLEHLTFNWLQKLKEKMKKKKNLENDNYWEEIKKSAKEK